MRRVERPAEAERRPRLLTDGAGRVLSVFTVIARVARLLDLDRPAPGERTQWTVRVAHGIYLVELEQFVSGTRVCLDGKTVGRSPAWSFPAVPFRFTIGASDATLAVRTDTQAGTIRATLMVDGARVAPDPPGWRRHRVRPVPWSRILELAGYGLGALLVAAAATGDPLSGWVTTALATAVDVAWIAGLRGIDPFAVLPGWIGAVTASRAGTLLFGVELIAMVTLARDPAFQGRLPVLGSGSRFWRVVGWGVLALAAALLPTLLDS